MKEGVAAFREKRKPKFQGGERATNDPINRCNQTRLPMISDNIFAGLKVVDLASFIAGPEGRGDPVRLWRGRDQG